MEGTPGQPLTILYIGTDETAIAAIQESGLFNMTVMPNGLQAIYWLTDNSFRVFNFDKDAESAPVYTEKQKLDAILCETEIPGMRGLSFFRKLKLHNIYTNIIFILLEKCHTGSLREEALDAGVDDYYYCRCTPERIYSRIQFLLKFKKEYAPKPLEAMIDTDLSPYKTPLIKRSFDIIVASIALLILSPVILFTMLAIRLESSVMSHLV